MTVASAYRAAATAAWALAALPASAAQTVESRLAPEPKGGPPADMIALAQTEAKAAPDQLKRAFAHYREAQFRGVRANWDKMLTSYDRIVFCGELRMKDDQGEDSGWTRFAYIPGDPNILATEAGAVGSLGGVGAGVRHNSCDTGREKWLPGDYTPNFTPPAAAAKP